MCDKLVFDLSQEVEGSPNIFIRKDWLNILDNQNQNYNNNQSVIDTSQLSNSNKWMNYREAYFNVPFIVSLATNGDPLITGTALTSTYLFTPNTVYDPINDSTPTPIQNTTDYAIGLKNWFGQIIHSFTLDYNGTTIIQQTPLINMWNSFRLMTSLSFNDILTQGPTIGFFPDDATSWSYTSPYASSSVGQGVCNNGTFNTQFSRQTYICNNFGAGGLNSGYVKRIQNINFDLDGVPSGYNARKASIKYADFLNGANNNGTLAATSNAMNLIWKNYIFNKKNQTVGQTGIVQYAITATIYLKHVHSFFNMVPLLKGVFMKMTLNLNNTTTEFTTTSYYSGSTSGQNLKPGTICVKSIQNPLGGCNPLMISSGINVLIADVNSLDSQSSNSSGGYALFGRGLSGTGNVTFTQNWILNISVGGTCLNTQISSSSNTQKSPLSQSVYLYVPAYTFNNPFEQAYLSQSVKTIKYTDVYQYQVLNIGSGGQINNLITNGISNVKSVLVLPFYSSSASGSEPNAYQVEITPGVFIGPDQNLIVSTNTGFTKGYPVWQSPFDPAGTGPTSPLCPITNFNIQVSGQNAIYNIQKYNFEQFNNQLYGQNSVNGGLTDGLTSGLIDRQAFDMEYCYYYVNIERMLPVEETVPKSIQLLGQNLSAFACDYIVFVEYGNEIKIDPLTGARV